MPTDTPRRPGVAGAKYVSAIQPWLRPLPRLTFAGFALLASTGACLAGVSPTNAARPGGSSTTPFTPWMVLAHGAVGLLGTLPRLVFGFAHYFTSRNRKRG